MLKVREQDFQRGQFRKLQNPVKYETDYYKVIGTMGTTHQPSIRIDILAKDNRGSKISLVAMNTKESRLSSTFVD